jgi:hypothetical protein
MKARHICAAGIDCGTRRHIRLDAGADGLRTDMLARYGGPFEIGNCIILKSVKPRQPQIKPHIEDYIFDSRFIVNNGKIPDEQFWQLLFSVSRRSLKRIFGAELYCKGESCVTPIGKREASLGCIIPKRVSELRICPDRPQVRVRVYDGEFDVDLGVTDVRFYRGHDFAPVPETVRRVFERLHSSHPVILSVGLTREYRGFHWLQVNNIHFEDDSVWRSN